MPDAAGTDSKRRTPKRKTPVRTDTKPGSDSRKLKSAKGGSRCAAAKSKAKRPPKKRANKAPAKARSGTVAPRLDAQIATAIDTMSEGFALFDPDDRLLLCNARWRDFMPAPPDVLSPGTRFEDMLRAGLACHAYPDATGREDEWLKERLAARHDPTQVIEVSLSGGRWVLVEEQPAKGGGMVSVVTEITELKRHEQEAVNQSELLADTLANMAQGLIAFDADLVILASNARAAQILDVSPELLRPGASFEDMIRLAGERGDYGQGDPEELIKKFRQMAKDREPQHFVRKRPDGSWLETRGYPRPGGGYVATYADITELKRREQEIARQSELLAATLDNMSQGLVVFDSDMTILTSNRRAATLLDVPEDLIQAGRPFETVIRIGAQRGDYGPGDVDEIAARYVAKGQERQEQHHERTLPDGTILQIRAHPRPDGGFVVTYTDVTEERRHEHEIAEKSELLGSALESMAQGLVAYDPDLTIVASNPKAAKLIEIPEKMVAPGANFADIVRLSARRGDYGPGDPKELNAKYLDLATNMPAQGVTVERTMPSGAVVEVQGLRRPAGGSVMTMTDITERKRSEERMRHLNDELKRSNTELEQFAYVASHDLQEPLRMVSSYCQLLQGRYQDVLDDDGKEFIEFAVDGANRMRGLIQDLLAYSRVGSQGNPFEPTDLGKILDAALLNLSVAIKESATEITRDTLPTVMADENQLVQLFQNLIGNAIKFRGDKPPKVHIGAERTDGEWRLSVRDNGVGIDPEFKDRIFVIFQRLENTMGYEGTGIGLAVCKKIIERHRGKIWVESQLGEGSTFYFTLPTKGADA